MFRRFAASPMLIGRESEPFDDDLYIYELKLDGERCIAYLDRDTVELRNKRNNRLLAKFSELSDINAQVSARCILDGELTVFKDGKPSFSSLLSRIMMSGRGLRAELSRDSLPACFTAFDILYYKDKDVTCRPLEDRKELLDRTVKRESERLAVSRSIRGRGVDFFALAAERGLEGIVAKRLGSVYRMGARTTDWIKIKVMQDDDFVVCGYIVGEGPLSTLVLGKYSPQGLVYRGHVTVGAGSDSFKRAAQCERSDACPFASVPRGNDGAIWLRPSLVCTVKFMHRTSSGGMRQPVFKALRDDKRPEECRE